MPKIPLLTTGLNGLVGSKFAQDFADTYDCTNLDITDVAEPTDITDLDQVQRRFDQNDAQAVIHLAAFTNVSAAWEDRGNKNGITYKVNVQGTENIIQAAEKTGKQLIYISTSYVFDGEKAEPYTEEDQPRAIEWYSETKLMAEELIKQATVPWTILRIDQPFRSDAFARPDLVRRIADGLKNRTLPPQFSDHYIGPTYLDDFSKVLDWVVRTKSTGIFHASSGEQWTDYNFALLVQEKLNLEGEIKPGSLDTYLETLNRPYQRNSAMNTNKLKSVIDFEPKSLTDALSEVKL